MLAQEFIADAHAPSAAREFVALALADLLDPVPSSLGEDAALVVSELVTNAVRAGSRVAAVDLTRDGQRITISVRDESEGWPEPREALITDVRGRGLPLVSAVSSAWGVRLAGDGKLVWAQLDIPDS